MTGEVTQVEAVGPDAGAAADPRLTGRQVKAGAAWYLIGFGATQVVRFASNLVLTRLVPKPEYGMFALVMTVLQGMQMLSDLGIWHNLIQEPTGRERYYRNAAFTIQLVRSIALMLIAAAASPWIAQFYTDEAITNRDLFASLIAVSAVSLLLNGFVPTSLYVAGRNLHVRRIVAVELGTQIAGSAATVIWALVSPTAWSLVFGVLFGGLVKPVLVLVLFRERDRLGWDRTARKKILTFGRWIMLSSALFFLSSQSDRLIFGKLVSFDTFAEYSVALSLAMIASEVVGRMVGGVFFPYLCRVDATALRDSMLRVRAPILALAAYSLSGLGGGASSVVGLLYKPEYAGASTSLMLLAPGVFIACGLDSTLSTALKAVGQPRWVAFGAFGKLVGMVALIPLGYSLGGFAGGVAGCSTAELIRYAVTLVGARRHGIFVPKQDLLWTLGLLVVGGLTWLVDQTLTANGVRIWPRSLLIFAFTTACWAPVLWHLRRSLRVRSG